MPLLNQKGGDRGPSLSSIFNSIPAIQRDPDSAEVGPDGSLDAALREALDALLTEAVETLNRWIPDEYSLSISYGFAQGNIADVPRISLLPPGQKTQAGFYLARCICEENHCQCIPSGYPLADVGHDHAFRRKTVRPFELLQKGKSPNHPSSQSSHGSQGLLVRQLFTERVCKACEVVTRCLHQRHRLARYQGLLDA